MHVEGEHWGHKLQGGLMKWLNSFPSSKKLVSLPYVSKRISETLCAVIFKWAQFCSLLCEWKLRWAKKLLLDEYLFIYLFIFQSCLQVILGIFILLFYRFKYLHSLSLRSWKGCRGQTVVSSVDLNRQSEYLCPCFIFEWIAGKHTLLTAEK